MKIKSKRIRREIFQRDFLSRNKKQINNLHMEFGIAKCKILNIERGKIINEGTELPN